MLGFFAHKKIGLPEHETPVGRFLPADVFLWRIGDFWTHER